MKIYRDEVATSIGRNLRPIDSGREPIDINGEAFAKTETVIVECCELKSKLFDEEEGKDISDALNIYTIIAGNIISTFKSKLATFDKKGVPYDNLGIVLSTLTEPISYLDECLFQKAPAENTRLALESVKKNLYALKETAEAAQVDIASQFN